MFNCWTVILIVVLLLFLHTDTVINKYLYSGKILSLVVFVKLGGKATFIVDF